MVGEPQMLGELARRRVAENPGRRDHDRGVAGAEALAGQQHPDVVCLFEVDPGVGQAIAGRECA